MRDHYHLSHPVPHTPTQPAANTLAHRMQVHKNLTNLHSHFVSFTFSTESIIMAFYIDILS